MSTPNFYKKNARHYYVADLEEYYEYDDLMGNIATDKRLKKYNEVDEWEGESKIFYRKDIDKGCYSLHIKLIIRSGYYSGATLDWEVDADSEKVREGYEREEDVDIDSETLPQYIRNFLNREIDKIEKVYADYTTPVIKVAQFSNGEAVYKKL